MPRPIQATIDLDALRHNYSVARSSARNSRALAVVKANAYGHGLDRVVRALPDADGFGLIELDWAVRIRESGFRARIVLLEGFFETSELPLIARHQLAAVVHSMEQIRMLADSGDASAGLDILVKVNSGMNRLGLAPGDVPAALAALRASPAVHSVSLMTHFATADDDRGIAWQLDAMTSAGGQEIARTFANSAAVLRHPDSHHQWVRPGIMLYGCSPFGDTTAAELGLRPVMTLAAGIIAIRDLAPGDTVGYGSSFVADRPTRIGVVACGYADGYPRHAPTGTPVNVNGRMTRTVGRVSMDMLCVDLTGMPDVAVGTSAVLWGAGNPIEAVAAAAGTVGYEPLCALAPRVPVREVG